MKRAYQTDYQSLGDEISSLIEGCRNKTSNYANVASAIYHALPAVNWAGFYLMVNGMLELGPFQGKPACIVIEPGKGVCGTAVRERRTLVVSDVHDFPGHITCDPASRSEIVVPLILKDDIIGVLDIDSPVKNRFDDRDRIQLEKIVSMLTKSM